MYVITVYLWAGDEIVIESRHLEVCVLYAEELYGDAMSGWDAKLKR